MYALPPNVHRTNAAAIIPIVYGQTHLFSASISVIKGARGSVVVKALCYKPEDRGFETR
jgi:hypothetical protein